MANHGSDAKALRPADKLANAHNWKHLARWNGEGFYELSTEDTGQVRYRVFICDNMAMSGDFKPLAAKHTRNFNLIDALSIGVDRLQRSWEPLRERVDFMRNKVLPITTAQALIYRAFTEGKFPVRLLKSVHAHYFTPKYEEFQPRTVWSLSNAFTSALKEARPDRQYELTARLGRFLAPVSTPAN